MSVMAICCLVVREVVPPSAGGRSHGVPFRKESEKQLRNDMRKILTKTEEEIQTAEAPPNLVVESLCSLSSSTSHRHKQLHILGVRQADLDPRVTVHYGIPSTASILALDRTQSLLAIGTLDGRIKVIGGDNIQELLTSPKPLPFKNLEFLQNQGFLASVSSENEIQVWDLEQRRIASSLQWECNITAFSVIYGTNYMYIGSEYAIVSVLKYDVEDGKIKLLPYYITANFIAEAAGMSLPDHLSVVGVLHQPNSLGNRQDKSLLVAYENGLIILWDASEDRVVLVRGSKDLKVKEKTVTSSPKDTRNELSDATEESKQVEKEISSLCWVSDNGSILAVGYVDGDIMFWDLSTAASTKDQKSEESDNNVAKLQLSSGDRRLPVIVLHWSANMLHKHHRGQLFVYGGDEIGSQEVLTVLSLDWSSGIESLKCISRTDLTLNGSFADMALLPTAAAMESSNTLLFILTNQGQLQVYDKACLSALMSEEQEKTAVPAVQYPMFIPTIEPYMTVAKLALVNTDKECSSAVSEQILVGKINAEDTSTTGGTKWPLTGGVPSQLNDAENYHVERVYVAGYQDGSVRIWDATYPALSLICVLGSEVKGIRSTVASATVSALDFCSVSLRLAVGDECGLVRLYKIIGGSDGQDCTL
ncbi:transducin family protein / WD-40 repeat family protein [Prunus dulcis]|uniref:Transducin family protein / WD-40 repeat family protein n=1 Tax=Prunus dulcis TaxID=3755 RepID=A0A4Y1R1T7_PRUDU|nr:transducin family protein / WD-40 repeat family protein [Prunus dulcis]